MGNPTPNHCPAAEGRSCKHGHAFTTGCLLPSERNVPSCCRDDLVFNEQRQAVTIVRTDAAARFAEWKARNAGVPASPPLPLNGIPATMHHGEGAYAQCGDCGRYTLDPTALCDRGRPTCACGSTHGWSGSFKRPGPAAKWSGRAPGVDSVDGGTK
jgi:hypothetical protein